MDILEAVFLGAVQGITEFLPISSSGHLIIVREVLGIDLSGSLVFDVVLHLATALAVLIYFRKDLFKVFRGFLSFFRKPEDLDEKNRKLFIFLAVGTVPAVLAGLLLESGIEESLRSPWLVVGALLFGSLVFYLAERFASGERKLGLLSSLAVGCFQAMALIPGMSRSGSSISGGLLFGLKREEAVRFGFLLSFPVVLGAGIKQILDSGAGILWADFGLSLVFGFLSAFLLGFLAIHFLVTYLKRHSLNVFIIYRVLLALTVSVFLAF